MKKQWPTWFFFFCLLSCSEKPGETEELAVLYSSPVETDGTILGDMPVGIIDSLVFIQRNDSPAFEVCVLKDDRLDKRREFVEIGKGPDEFEYP